MGNLTREGRPIPGLGAARATSSRYAYNAQGQEIWKQDQAGTVLETDFDLSGAQTQRRDGDSGLASTTRCCASRRATTGSAGRASVDQYNDATVGSGRRRTGSKLTYDDWGNVASYSEDKDSAVSGGGNQYTTSLHLGEGAPTGQEHDPEDGHDDAGLRGSITYSYALAGGLHDDERVRVTPWSTAGR